MRNRLTGHTVLTSCKIVRITCMLNKFRGWNKCGDEANKYITTKKIVNVLAELLEPEIFLDWRSWCWCKYPHCILERIESIGEGVLLGEGISAIHGKVEECLFIILYGRKLHWFKNSLTLWTAKSHCGHSSAGSLQYLECLHCFVRWMPLCSPVITLQNGSTMFSKF